MTDAHRDAPSSDSSGMRWTGRALRGTGFDDDLGEADFDLIAALDDPQDETGLMKAVARARLLVPIVAVRSGVDDSAAPSGVDDSAAPTAEAVALKSATDLAVVTLTLPDGQRALPVFSSLAALSAWDIAARPSPVTSARAAQAAVSERCDVILLDLGSGHECVLRPSMVWALAQQREWLPAHTDPFVAQALSRATADEADVIDCVGESDPVGEGILRVVLRLRPGLDSAQVQALATRVGEQIATDGEARARIDGLAFTIRQA
ncbi:MAG: SseB family protein [Phycicoccus sp.]|nr:SseB family protein [Phycicoccus sp.]NMM32577.1 SseB family protein [Phycicoccus sp.]